MNFDEMKGILANAAREAGIEKYEIYYSSGSELSAETLKDELSNFSCGTTCGLCFRCLVNGRFGYASTALMEPSELSELVKRAANNARFIESDDESVIFGGSPEYGKKTSEYQPLPEVASIKSTALALQKENYAQSEYVTDGTSSACIAYESETRIFNSEGLDLCNKASMSGSYVNVVLKKDGEPAEAFAFSRGIDIASLGSISAEAHTTAVNKLGAGEVTSGKYDVIIDGKQMRSILSAFWSVFSGRSARLGLSLLAGKNGTRVADECVTISDDPFDPECPVQTTFDAEGVAVYRKNVIENGILKTLLYNLTEASRAGVTSTANAYKGGYADTVSTRPYRFAIEPGKYSLDELFGIAGNGIYITEIKGLHAGANETTGDFSIESAGFMIENGKKGRPVKSFTIAGNFYELLKSITHIGNKSEYGIPGGTNVFASPAVLVGNISVAGK